MNITAENNSNHALVARNFSFVASAIFCVIHDFLLKTAPSLVLTTSCRYNASCNFYRDVLTQLFRTWDKTEKLLQIVKVDNDSQRPALGKRNRNLILIDSYEAFLNMDIISYTYKNNFNELNYIILVAPQYLMKDQLQQILEYCWSNQIINCTVQVESTLGEIFVYTYFPYTANHCGKVVPILINQYNGSVFVEQHLFPKKLQNMHGCPLRVATWAAPPFIYFSPHDNVTRGIEGRLLQTLASNMNFTIELKVPPFLDAYGKPVQNIASYALLMLQNRSADFSLGALRESTERDVVASCTVSYYQSKQVFTALDAAFDFTSWQILIFPFKTSSWLLIIFTFMLVVLKATITKRIYKLCPIFYGKYFPKYLYLNIFATFIGSPATNMPRSSNGRFTFLNWLYFTFIIRTLYQAVLFHLICTHVHNSLPDNIEDLINLKFTAVMTARSYEAVKNLSAIGRLPKIIFYSSVESSTLAYIKKKNTMHYMAVAPQECIMYFAQSSENNGVFRILSTHLVALPLTMYMTKHSFLIDQFNEELLRMSVAGFIDLWRRWELDDKILEDTGHKQNKVFSFQELYMLFVLLGIGLLFACLIFMLELMAKGRNILIKFFDKD